MGQRIPVRERQGEGNEQREGYAGKECLISGSRAGKVLPRGYMRA